MSDQFIDIDSPEAMDHFLWLVDGFHDALLREVGIVCRGYVDPEGWMLADLASDARLVIHSQFPETPYIEIVVEEVQALSYDPRLALDAVGGVVTDGEVALKFGLNLDSVLVAGRKMRYRILGREFLKKEPRTVDQIVESNH